MDLADLIESVNIVEYIGQYVELEQRGDEWWGLSCFTDEKTPSFSVRLDPPVWYCYSSAQGGGLFRFVRLYHRCSPEKAIEIIKEYAGYDGDVSVHTDKLAATLDCKRFMPPKQGSKHSSGTVLPDDVMERYEKREDKLQIWRNEGISDASLDKFQVRYDSFSNRLVYPIRNWSGQIVNIGGRTLNSDWKQKKLRKYTYFHQFGEMSVIYGLSENLNDIIEKREIILFEGCKSVLIADTWGIRNCGAILTSHLSKGQMKQLAVIGVRTVFALDKEINPRKDKNIQQLRCYVNVDYMKDRNNLLSEKESPVDQGKEVFLQLYRERIKWR